MPAVSLTKFRAKLFPFFDLMKDTGLTVEVYHRRKIYEVTIMPTNRKAENIYRKPQAPRTGLEKIPYNTCPDCGELMVGKVCLSDNHEAKV